MFLSPEIVIYLKCLILILNDTLSFKLSIIIEIYHPLITLFEQKPNRKIDCINFLVLKIITILVDLTEMCFPCLINARNTNWEIYF